MDIVSQEALAWLRAHDVAGVELPDSIIEARSALEKVDGELAALPQPSKVPGPAELVAAGVPLEEATDESDRIAEEARRREETQKLAVSARNVARRTLSRLVAEQRFALVLGVRPLVTALVDEARPHAGELAQFAPGYDPGAIVRKATPKQLKAFQAAEELERKFGAIMAAWRASFKAAARRGGHAGDRGPAGFDLRWVEQAYRYWGAPEWVKNPRLNGTHKNQRGYEVPIQPTVLGVASEPEEAGFRLAAVDELHELHEAARRARAAEQRADLPWSRQRRMRAI